MHGLLYDVEINNNQISFGHSLLEDFEDFRSNFSNSMNGFLEERTESLDGECQTLLEEAVENFYRTLQIQLLGL